MYIPEHFRMKQQDAMYKIIRSHPLGVLVTLNEQGIDANHLPFELDADRMRLTAHVAWANPVWEQCSDQMPVLVVFRGDASYVSPNWYLSKHAFHRQVPTWNYEAVHVHGRITIQDHENFVRGLVARLTRTHEASEPKPWRMTDSAPDYIDRMLKAIVGIEIAIERMEGKAKLSQNREDRDRLQAAEMLESKGHAGLAEAMRQA